MPSCSLKVYSEFSLYGKSHKVFALEPPYVWYRRPDGEDQKMNIVTLLNHPTYIPSKSLRKEKDIKIETKALVKLTEKKRAEVSERFEVILPLILLDQIKGEHSRVKQVLR